MMITYNNIDEVKVGSSVIDTTDNRKCEITDKTSSSVQVFITKRTKNGIDCTQWLYIDDFKKRFKGLV